MRRTPILRAAMQPCRFLDLILFFAMHQVPDLLVGVPRYDQDKYASKMYVLYIWYKPTAGPYSFLFSLVLDSLYVYSCQSIFHKKNERSGMEIKQENLVRGSVKNRQGKEKK